MKKLLPRIAITLGDPAGIGPEIVNKTIAARQIYRWCRPVVVGDCRLLQPGKPLPCPCEDIPIASPAMIRPGQVSVTAGKAAYAAICRAVQMIEEGRADAVVTAPISKAALNLAGVHYAGHTELLAALTGTKDYAMLMVAGDLRAVMVTRHVPLMRVADHLSRQEILRVARLAEKFLVFHCGVENPRIVMCGLNPHAGESGLLGKEEGSSILPAVQALAAEGLHVTGPLPGDSAWVKMKSGLFDLLIGMYHDQVMTGLKCIAPEKIVNVTAGLPFIRTSPGHGTGFDIAGQGCADPSSMIEAVRVAAHYAGVRMAGR